MPETSSELPDRLSTLARQLERDHPHLDILGILALANAQAEAAKARNSALHGPAISRDHLINHQTHPLSRNLRPPSLRSPPPSVAHLFNTDTAQEMQLPPFLLPISPTPVVEPVGTVHPQQGLTTLSTVRTNTHPIEGLYSFKLPA